MNSNRIFKKGLDVKNGWMEKEVLNNIFYFPFF